MATHSSVLAWRIPGMGEPGGLPFMGRTESDSTEATQQQQQQRLAAPSSWGGSKNRDEVGNVPSAWQMVNKQELLLWKQLAAACLQTEHFATIPRMQNGHSVHPDANLVLFQEVGTK